MGRLGPPRPRARPAPPRGTSQARKPPPHVNGAQTGKHFECMNHEVHDPWEASLRAHLLPYSPHTQIPRIYPRAPRGPTHSPMCFWQYVLSNF